jgi:hypothetical protein
MRFRRAQILAAIAAILTIVPAAAAATPPPYGGLTQRPGAAGCTTTSAHPPCAKFNGFYYPGDAQMTPDGKQLILTDPGNDAVVTYNRAADGSLTYGGCISKDGTGEQPKCATDGLLISPEVLAVSPDGRQLYVVDSVTSSGAGVMVTLNRNPATGALTAGGCFALHPSFLCGGAASMSGAQAIAISGDGRLLAVGGDHAIVVFKRNPANGTLTDVGCVGDGTDPSCVNGGAGYDDIEGVAFAPDGRAVYGAARAGGAVLVAGYNPASSHPLSALQCLSSAPAPAGCTATSAVFAPNWVAVSPAGAGAPAVYTADFNGGEISTFIRNPDDTLTWLACRSYDGSAGGTPGICQVDYRLQLVARVMVGPDGRNVYAISPRSNPKQGSQDIAIYNRDQTSGLITPLPDPNSCWADSDTGPEGHCQNANGLADPVAMALSPNGDQMYVAVNDDQGDLGGPQPPAGIAIFNREVPPTCAPVTASTTAGKPVSLTLACTGANGLPVTRSIVTAPKHGGLAAVSSAGVITFTPAKNFAGTDQFTFAASDGSLSSSPATATIHVAAPAPVKLTIRGHAVHVVHGVAKIKLSCRGPAGRTCSGKLTLSARLNGRRRTIGSARFAIKTGRSRSISVRISARKLHSVQPAQASARYTTTLAQTASASANVTLKLG